MHNTKCTIQNAEYTEYIIKNTEYKTQNSKYRIRNIEVLILNAEDRIQITERITQQTKTREEHKIIWFISHE